MPWYFPWSDSIKKRACRYLLQHYLGHFLQEKLTLEQLTVDLYNGTGQIENVPLDVWSVNEMLDSCGVPFEIIDGYINKISVSVPWSALLNDSCCMDIQGLELTLASRQRSETGSGSLTESMIFNTMTTSMELAQECLKQGPSPGEEQAEATTQSFEGLESFAQTIESVLSRIKLSFSDTVIRLEHLPKETKSGIGLEIHIKRIDYTDLSTEVSDKDNQYKAKSVYEPAAFAFKNLKIFGVSAYLDEFHEAQRTMPPGFDPELPSSPPPSPTSGMSSPSISPSFNGMADQLVKPNKSSLLPSIQIGKFSGHLELKVKLKQNVLVTGSKIDVECFFGTLNVFLAPRQVHLLLELASALTLAGDMSEPIGLKGAGTTNKVMQPEDYKRIEEDLQNQLHAKKNLKRMESGHNKVESWNFSFDSNTAVETSSHFSSGTEYDSVLGDDSEEKFYSMPSSQWSSGHDVLPPLEEPLLPADMMATKRLSGSVLTQGFGTIPQFNATGPSLTEAAGNIYANTQSKGVQGLSPLSDKTRSAKPTLPLNPGLAGIAALEDPSPETMHLKLKFSSVAITILHVDPVLSPVSDDQTQDDVNNHSSHPLLQMADKFFGGLGTYGFGGKDFEDMKERLVEACPNDHLRCMLAPLNIDFEKTTCSSYHTISSDVSIGRMEVLEYLYERLLSDTLTSPALYSSTQLLNFQPREEIKNAFYGMAAYNSTPCLRARYKNTQRTSSPGGIQARNAVLPKTELSFEVGKLCSEVDITIIDRLEALFNPQPLYSTQSSSTHSRMFKSLNPTSINQQAVFTQALDEGPTSDQRLNVALTCPKLIIMLRFPIPDLRPVVERRPWWKQALREESLLLEFSSLEFKTILCSADATSSYEFQFQELNGFFKESKEASAVPLLKASTMATDNESSNCGFDWPCRVVITIQPAASLSVLEEEHSANNSPLSSLEAYPVMKSESTPFSSKPVMYEAEELVLPGSQEEMVKFQGDTVSSSHVHIECSFPRLDVNLHEKEFFEMIYNRIASDLLLWEPTAPSPVDRSDIHASNIGTTGLDLASQLLQGPDKFVMCRSGLRSYDDSSSDEEDSSNFTSPEHRNNRRGVHENNNQTMLAVTLNVVRGRLALFPVSQEKDSQLKPEESSEGWNEDEKRVHGQLMADIEDLTFFVAACYKGQVDLTYMCLYSKQLHLKHASLVSSDVHETMETAFSGAELQYTLYPTEQGLKRNSGDNEEPMFSLAAKFLLDPVKNIKEIVLALGLRDVTMRHSIVPSSQLWLTQISEYLDVQDYPILGFLAPSVVTVLHAHVWQGAVDYRPVYLPLRVLLTMDSFSVSSNLAIESSVSLLRFIIDDAALYLSDKCSGQSNLKNYVCVMDLGLFELSLLTSDGNDKRHPKIELRMFGNTLHVRTCCDSCSALLQLIQYIAADGDLVQGHKAEDSHSISSPPTPSRCSSDLPVEQGSLDESKMSSLMCEAMDDDLSDGEAASTKICKDDSLQPASKSPKRELFLFPDDQPELKNEAEDAMEGLAIDEPAQQHEEEVDSDDDFCILDHPDREPEGLTDDVVIKTLLQSDIKIVENHFPVTIGRSDQLSAPDHYPPAVFRYCLREMSLVWQMYGGRDLGHHGIDKDKKKRITFASDVGSPTRLPTTDSPKATSAVRSRGGMGRQTDILMEFHLNKIRFQFEEYPEETEQASRLVLLAQEVEVRDRLAHSQINKFLYQYTSEARPKQTHANMITIKMLYLRPDPELKAQECCLRVSIQPLRLNVDQDALFFLRDFFAEISGEASKNSKSSSSVESSPTKQAKAFSNSQPGSSPDLQPPDDEELLCSSLQQETRDETCNSPHAPTFFRSFTFSPEVPIRLDYQGKHVDMEQGTFTGLLIGLAQLNCSELTLKRLCCRNGLLGFDRVINYALSEWLNDIKRTQLPSILGGVGPVHSFVQLFQGMVDLVWMPIEQYRRDGRVMRGLQRGANSFTTSSAMAFLELTNRAVHLVQTAAETAYDMVSPGPSVSPSKHGRHRLAHQPADLREGVTNAYHVVAKGINHTATNIVKVAREEHEQKGMTGVVGGVLRQVPATIVQPFILATEATSNVIGGVRNQILPDARREATEKWRSDY